MDDAHDAENTTERQATCQACHRRVPGAHIVFIAGRQLCHGCASAWFDDEE